MPRARSPPTRRGKPKPVLRPRQANRCTVPRARRREPLRVCLPCKEPADTRPLSARAMNVAWNVLQLWPGWPSALPQDLQRLALPQAAGPEPVADPMRADKAVGVVDADSRFSTSFSSSRSSS